MTRLELPRRFRQPSALPGFAPALGVTLLWLTLIVLIPLAALASRPWEIGLAGMWRVLANRDAVAALRLSFSGALLAAIIDLPLGLLLAWVLIRVRFPGRRLIDALVDLPFALPTAVAGIALTALYVPNGWLGRLLAPLGFQVSYAVPGIVVAMMFVGLPFVVRTMQPVLEDLPAEVEEAAATLGATRWQTVWRVVMPAILPTLLGGFGLAFARAVGEYGSVIFIAGNKPGLTQIAPLLIVTRLEEFDYAGATILALIMLVGAFLVLGCVTWIQRRLPPRSD
jgi:sulfate transport system permease protein